MRTPATNEYGNPESEFFTSWDGFEFTDVAGNAALFEGTCGEFAMAAYSTEKRSAQMETITWVVFFQLDAECAP